METYDIKISFSKSVRHDGSLLDFDGLYAAEVSDECASLIKSFLAEGKNLNSKTVEELKSEHAAECEELLSAIAKSMKEHEIEVWIEESIGSQIEVVMEAMQNDIDAGIFVPETTFEEFCETYKEENGIDDDDFDEEDAEDEYQNYLFEEEYRLWLADLDLYEQAERTGVDTDACGDFDEFVFEIIK